LDYFGERTASGECDNCDNCITPPERVDATVAAAKLLSCVYRVRKHGGFATGAHHLVDVLLGKPTEKVAAWGHDRVSTFGVGADRTKDEWMALISELLRLGLIEQEPDRRTIVLTAQGVEALKDGRTIECAKPRTVRKAKRERGSKTRFAATAPGDSSLFEELRKLRKALADEQGVPPYVVFSDATLRELCAQRPVTLGAFRQVGGVGDVKLERYGEVFVDAIRSFGTG
jgi:ATP-dependent DNA helicase RecQ